MSKIIYIHVGKIREFDENTLLPCAFKMTMNTQVNDKH